MGEMGSLGARRPHCGRGLFNLDVNTHPHYHIISTLQRAEVLGSRQPVQVMTESFFLFPLNCGSAWNLKEQSAKLALDLLTVQESRWDRYLKLESADPSFFNPSVCAFSLLCQKLATTLPTMQHDHTKKAVKTSNTFMKISFLSFLSLLMFHLHIYIHFHYYSTHKPHSDRMYCCFSRTS